MPLQPLTVPTGHNQFFSAASLALLLPILGDEERLDSAIECLFGRLSLRACAALAQELDAYSNASFPASLTSIIQTKLRPKLADYILAHQEEFTRFSESRESLLASIEDIREGRQFFGPLECTALVHMTNMTVRLYRDEHGMELSVEYLSPKGTELANGIMHLAYQEPAYQCLIDPASLPETMRQHLFPSLRTLVAGDLTAVEPAPYKHAKLKFMLTDTLSKIPGHLLALSEGLGREPIHLDPFLSLNPTDLRGMMRLDPKRESHAVRADLTGVDLTTVYSLCLKAESDGNFDRNRLYIEMEEGQFRYCVRSPDNVINEGIITFSELDPTLKAPVTIEQLNPHLPQILAITAGNGHTTIVPASIGDARSWGRSLGISTAVGVAGGLSTVGAVVVGGELLGAGAGVAAIPLVGIPIAVTTLLGTLVLAAFGKRFAVEFETAIDAVSRLVSQENYSKAADHLDEEFNSRLLTRAARSIFLTKQHYAIAHFFRGFCADRMGMKYVKIAYAHYQAACADLRDTKSSLTVFVTKLQLLRLLKRCSAEQLPEGIDRDNEMTKLLRELAHDYGNGFTELYWQLHDRMTMIANRFVEPEPLSTTEIKLANTFLLTDGLLLLRHFRDGFGAFMELLGVFSQGAVLAYFKLSNPAYLDEDIKNKLALELSCTENSLEELGSKKFQQCAELLRTFKATHRDQIGAKPAIASAIALMETFMLHFHLLAVDKTSSDAVLPSLKLARILGLEARHATLLANCSASVEFMVGLKREFGLSHERVDTWLEAILEQPSTIANQVSERTGNTMLHALVKLRLPSEHAGMVPRVREAARRLIDYRYERNALNQTPLFELQSADPYGLKAILCPEPFVKTGSELDSVEAFVKRISANPAIDGHFLLLDGPSGTGKTGAVRAQLKSLGYPVQEWPRGAKGDQYHGGKVTRITEFFERARTGATAMAAASRPTDKTVLILFIDEIDGIMPRVTGEPETGCHDGHADVTAFQTEITDLKNQRVVLIGTTNFPERLPDAILRRAGVNRIYFPLPNAAQRLQLLTHFFREKQIPASCIETLASVSVGYSPGELELYVGTLRESSVTLGRMTESFNAYARTLTRAFKDKFRCAEIFMPSFEREGDLGTLFSSNRTLAEQLVRLQRPSAVDPRLHTLLYGPPGGGKTTAVRVFAQTSGQVLISVQADHTLPSETLSQLFTKAKQYGRAIIFFDEVDRLAHSRSSHTGFLQTEMDGITANTLTIIGATNYPERLEPAISSRFVVKIKLPTLTATQLNRPIKKSLLDSIARYKAEEVHFDAALAAEMQDGAIRLGQESVGLNLRNVNACLSCLMGDLDRAKRGGYAGITYLRMQDVCLAFLRTKIQEGLTPGPEREIPTSTDYITTHRDSFFPSSVPLDHVPASEIILRAHRRI